ncbi:MAG: metallophosphoesterase family protein [Lacipirellulaceae bacterium]
MDDSEEPEPRVIAIGDIHGCLTAFRSLVEALGICSGDTLVILGDVIDRGPDSRGVLDVLLELKDQCQLVCLLGNHEQMLIDVVESRMPLSLWLGFGGEETLDSYLEGGTLSSFDANHLEFIQSWGDYFETASHFFAHGNFEAGIALAKQPWHEMRWISLRESIPLPHLTGKTAVVGHTSNKQGKVVNLGHLICLDTYCYGGGWLTALDVTSGVIWQADQQGQVDLKTINTVEQSTHP